MFEELGCGWSFWKGRFFGAEEFVRFRLMCCYLLDLLMEGEVFVLAFDLALKEGIGRQITSAWRVFSDNENASQIRCGRHFCDYLLVNLVLGNALVCKGYCA